jgi:hypothetical protein
MTETKLASAGHISTHVQVQNVMRVFYIWVKNLNTITIISTTVLFFHVRILIFSIVIITIFLVTVFYCIFASFLDSLKLNPMVIKRVIKLVIKVEDKFILRK